MIVLASRLVIVSAGGREKGEVVVAIEPTTASDLISLVRRAARLVQESGLPHSTLLPTLSNIRLYRGLMSSGDWEKVQAAIDEVKNELGLS